MKAGRYRTAPARTRSRARQQYLLRCFLKTSTIESSRSSCVQKLLEYRRLENAKANPQSDADENDRERERIRQPGEELIAVNWLNARTARFTGTGRRARRMRPGWPPAALTVGADHSIAKSTSRPHSPPTPMPEASAHCQITRPRCDRGISGHERVRKVAIPMHKRVAINVALRPIPITVVTEYRRTNRAPTKPMK